MSEMYLYFVQSNKSFRVDGSEVIVGGRTMSLCNLRLAHYFEREDITGDIGAISGKHFKVYKERIGDDFYIMDIGSKNGTEVNRRQLVPDNPQKLSDGDVIRLARCDNFIIKVRMDTSPTAVIQPESGVYFDADSHQFMVDRKPITDTIPEMELRLLKYLYKNVGQICSYEDIFNAMWNFEGNNSQDIAPVVRKIRKKLNKVSKGAGKRYIKTIQNEGYMLYH